MLAEQRYKILFIQYVKEHLILTFYTTSKDEEGKEMYHARVVNFQHIDTDYLAKEIQIATSLTEGDVKSVLESLSHFMGDRLREGQSVHLDGIGYFQIKLNSKEPITSPKQKANQMKLCLLYTSPSPRDA